MQDELDDLNTAVTIHTITIKMTTNIKENCHTFPDDKLKNNIAN
jgi:hypothetical protein